MEECLNQKWEGVSAQTIGRMSTKSVSPAPGLCAYLPSLNHGNLARSDLWHSRVSASTQESLSHDAVIQQAHDEDANTQKMSVCRAGALITERLSKLKPEGLNSEDASLSITRGGGRGILAKISARAQHSTSSTVEKVERRHIEWSKPRVLGAALVS